MTHRQPGSIEDAVEAYLALHEGDHAAALRNAVLDLMDASRESAFRLQVLEQWVSRGYVQGRASQVLDRMAGRREGVSDRLRRADEDAGGAQVARR